MERFDILGSLAQSTLPELGENFESIQLSYSTAEVEKTIFFAPEFAPEGTPKHLVGPPLIVVHGEFFKLEEGNYPQPAIPLTEESGLFRLIGPNDAL